VHQLEYPLIEDLDSVAYDDPGPRVTALLVMSLVETILDDEPGAQVAGHAGAKVCRSQYCTFDWDRSAWCEGGGKRLPRNARLGHNHACQRTGRLVPARPRSLPASHGPSSAVPVETPTS
jgi:hypothetical protein